MTRLFTIYISIFLVSTAMLVPANLEQQPDESNTSLIIKASFLYQFSSNNDWPAEVKKGKFLIGVLGDHSLYTELASRYGSKPVGSQVLEALELIDLPENKTLHILFVDKSKKAELPRIIKALAGKHTLIVTNWEGALSQGAAINFKTVESNIRYELSEKATIERGISLGVKIKNWAIK